MMEKYAACLNLNGLEWVWFSLFVIMRATLEHGLIRPCLFAATNTQAWCPNNVGKCARMNKIVHSLVSVSIKSIEVAESSCTSLDELTLDCLAFVTQQLQQRQERLVVSRQPVFVLVLVLLLAFVSQSST